MNKVYFLLRNNTQSGPFTYPQLVQQKLKPTDLVWVDGESTSWLTPEELLALRKRKPLRKTAVAAVPFVAPTPASIEPPALAPITPVLPFKKQFSSAYTDHAVHHSLLSDRLGGLSDESIEIRVHKKARRTISLDQLAAAAFIALVASTAWYGRHQFFAGRSETVSSVVSPAAFMNEQSFAAKKSEPQISTSMPDTLLIPGDVIKETTSLERRPVAVRTQGTSTYSRVNDALQEESIQETSTTQKPEVKEQSEESKETEVRTKSVEKPAVATTSPPVEEKTTEPTETAGESDGKKKKSFGQAIKGIFKKKKKDPEDNSGAQ